MWSNSNCLVLNPKKTKYLILGTRTQIRKIISLSPKIKLQNTQVELVSVAINLGVLMDENLRFDQHILQIVRNCFYRLKLLYQIRKYLKPHVRVKLCEALVLSKLNYADIVTCPRLLMRTKNLIQKVQNACARYCFNVPPRSHVTPYLNSAKMLKINYRSQLHFATLLFGIVKYKMPLYLYHKLK